MGAVKKIKNKKEEREKEKRKGEEGGALWLDLTAGVCTEQTLLVWGRKLEMQELLNLCHKAGDKDIGNGVIKPPFNCRSQKATLINAWGAPSALMKLR